MRRLPKSSLSNAPVLSYRFSPTVPVACSLIAIDTHLLSIQIPYKKKASQFPEAAKDGGAFAGLLPHAVLAVS